MSSRVDPGQAAADARLGRLMHVGMVVALAAAMTTIVVPASALDWLGVVAVVVVIGLPLLRVLLLVRRWLVERDVRYAMIGGGLLAVIAFGTAIAMIRG